MLVMILNHKNRNAVADMYKNIANEMNNKEDIAVVVPSKYDMKEYDEKFYRKIPDVISKINGYKKIYSVIKLANKIKGIFKNKAEKKILFFHENAWINILLYFLLGNRVNYYVWIHDPVAHIGEFRKTKIIRWIAFHTYIKKAEKIFIGYTEGKEILNNINKIPDEKIKILYLPQLKELEFPKIKSNILTQKPYDYIFFGSIEKYKGIDILLKAFSDKKLEKVKLLIIGRGKEDLKVKDTILNMKNVDFINEYVPNEILARYIQASNMVILPYRTATGSQTIQVSNYYNKMVLATKVGCFNEYIKEGKNGFFIKNGDCSSIVESALKYRNFKVDDIQKKKIYNVYKIFDLKTISKKLYQYMN